MTRILVVGGGIGGLSIGIGLQRMGVDVVVLERAPEVRAIGAGLVVYPNAKRALQFLGLAEQVKAGGRPIGRQETRTGQGRVLARTDASKLGASDNMPALGITRSALQRAMVDALDPGGLHLASEVKNVSHTPDGVVVSTADGREQTGDLLIGADGLRSTVRTSLLGESPPRYAGYTSWRGLAKGIWLNVSFEAWGPGQRFGGIQVEADVCYWFAVADDRALQAVNGREGLDAVRALFQNWAAPVPSLLESTAADAVVRTDISDRDPSVRWGEGRVTMLGDAAHASTPNLGQGAAMAIEDAVVLARCLEVCGPVPQALRAYEQTRMPRARRVVLESRKLGAVGQWRNPTMRFLRDRLLPFMPESTFLRRYSWLMNYDAGRVPIANGVSQGL